MARKAKPKRKSKPIPPPITGLQESNPACADNSASSLVSLLYKWWSYVWGCLGPVLTVFSLYYAFYPSISITPGGQLDPKDPFSIPFTIGNNNLFSVHDIRAAFHLDHLIGFTESGTRVEFEDCGINTLPTIDKLPSKVSIVRFLDVKRIVHVKRIKEAEISLELYFKPPWPYPQNPQFHQRYSAYVSDEGNIYWLPTYE